MTELLLIGGPTVRLRYAGLTFLTDPTFDPPGDYEGRVTLHKLTGPALTVDEIGPVDAVLLSHDEHADNLDHSGRALLADVPVVLSEPGAAQRLPGVTGLEPWASTRVGDVTVTAVPALHGPEGCEPLTGVVTGFVLHADGEPTVYVSGDNASVDLVGEIASRFQIDVAVLFTGAGNVGAFGDTDITLNRRTAVQAARLLGDATIVPAHADGWDHFSETRESLARAFEYADLGDRLLLLEPGVAKVL
jgi:L-ascorbate metabolism protein UlaG (beta-lactamase superfamily)